jgi:chromosome segregation ATPase
MQKVQMKFDELKKRIEEKRAQITAKKSAFQTKKDEFDAFKDALLTKKSEMIDLRNTANMLHAQNAKLSGDLKNSLESIKENDLVLSDETKLALEDSMAQIKEIAAKIQATKGQIHDLLMTNKEYIKSKDYISMETLFDEIFAIELYRNECLSQINTILQDMIKLLIAVV